MRSRQAWLTLFAAVLGVDASGCRKEGPHASPAGSVDITPAPSAAPSVASAELDAADVVDAALAASPADAGKPVARTRADAGQDLSALLNSNSTSGDLNSLMQTSCGASSSANLHASCGGTAVQPGGIGLSGLTGSGTIGAVDAGPAPRTDATVSIVSGAGGNDARVVAGLRPGMRACFNAMLAQDPTTPDGHVTLSVSIAPTGEVSSVAPSSSTLAPADLACITRRARNVQFDAASSGRTLVLTVEQRKLR